MRFIYDNLNILAGICFSLLFVIPEGNLRLARTTSSSVSSLLSPFGTLSSPPPQHHKTRINTADFSQEKIACLPLST
jgi:hypothetical protein